jgi:hypothetical protein
MSAGMEMETRMETDMAPSETKTPAGWRLTLPLANLKGADRARGGTWAAAIPDRSAARKAIPYGSSVPSAPLQPLSADELERLGVGPGEVRKI